MQFHLLAAIIIIILLYFLPLTIKVDYKRENNKDKLNLSFKFFILSYNLKLSFIDFKRLFSLPTTELRGKFSSLFFETDVKFREEITDKEIKELKRVMKVIKRIIDRFELVFLLTHNCSFFSWQSSFGCANPAVTGILTGILWSAKSSLVAILQTKLNFKELPIIEVKPNFTKPQPLLIKFSGIFNFRLGQLILIALGVIYFELRRRFKFKWKNIQLLS